MPELEKFLFWLQQLLSESLGKKGRGLLPVVSNAPKDHHSLLQLYLDGPKDKLFHIFSLEENTKEKIMIKKLVILFILFFSCKPPSNSIKKNDNSIIKCNIDLNQANVYIPVLTLKKIKVEL